MPNFMTVAPFSCTHCIAFLCSPDEGCFSVPACYSRVHRAERRSRIAPDLIRGHWRSPPRSVLDGREHDATLEQAEAIVLRCYRCT